MGFAFGAVLFVCIQLSDVVSLIAAPLFAYVRVVSLQGRIPMRRLGAAQDERLSGT